MYTRWTGRNVDLALLIESIEGFLSVRGCKISRKESERRCLVVGRPENTSDVLEDVSVKISGEPNDFTVEFISGGKSRSSILLGFLTSMIGGGNLMLKGVRSQESSDKLEKEFWSYLEEKMVGLTNSVKNDQRRKQR